MWEHSFRDKVAEHSLFRARAIVLAVFILIFLGILAWRMAYLQITCTKNTKTSPKTTGFSSALFHRTVA